MLPGVAYTIYPLGDEGLTIELGDRIDPLTNQRCLDLAGHLLTAGIPGVKDIVPAFASVSLLYDAAKIRTSNNITSSFHFIKTEAEKAIATCPWKTAVPNRTLVIPVCYENEWAPDLEQLAGEKNITPAEVIRIHCSRPYRVYMLGFLPGFAYMGMVNNSIAAPRLAQPRLHVAAGSIGIAGGQTGIYPLDSPGGWNIIGRTPVRIFDARKGDPCLLKAGDEVTFQPITPDMFHQLNEHS
jgi:inhibitor of KinA